MAINVGILLGFVAGWAFRGLDDSVAWRWTQGRVRIVRCVPPLICFIPDSLRYSVPLFLRRYCDRNPRWMLGVGGLPPLLVLACLCCMPESPRWLVRRGRDDEAAEV